MKVHLGNQNILDEENTISILKLQPALPELALALLDPGLLLA